jgi:hypothetical protein
MLPIKPNESSRPIATWAAVLVNGKRWLIAFLRAGRARDDSRDGWERFGLGPPRFRDPTRIERGPATTRPF